jgi:tetratricopeptide (TPR) repeat protein
LLEGADRAGDQAQVAAAHEGFGLALVHQERYADALPHLRQKYDINKSLGNRLYEARGLMQMALALWPLGRVKEARDFVKQASEIAGQSADKSYVELQTWLALVNARMALSEGRAGDAARESSRAIELAGGDNREVSVEAKYALGLALSQSGSPREGLKRCEEASALAEGMGDPHYLTGALLALSEVSLAVGNAQGALDAALRAQTLSYKSGMRESEWRAWALAARASRRPGGAESEDYASRARSVLSDIEQRWGADAFAGYLSRPDVQRYVLGVSGSK